MQKNLNGCIKLKLSKNSSYINKFTLYLYLYNIELKQLTKEPYTFVKTH